MKNINDKDFPRSILELYRFCSTDNNKENLQYIDISKSSIGETIATATDGAHLATITISNVETGSFRLHYKDAKELLKGSKSTDEFTLNSDSSTLCFKRHRVSGTYTDSRTLVTSYEFDRGDLHFPDFEQVLKPELNNGVPYSDASKFRINTKFINTLYSYLSKIGDTAVEFITDRYHDGSPVMAKSTCDDYSLTYVVMPIR